VEQGYRPLYESDAMTFGTFGHLGLERYWLTMQASPSDSDSWLVAGLAEIEQWERDDYTKAAHRALLIGYHERWADSPLHPIAVEHQYTAPLVNPATGAASRTWQAAGKIDVIARDSITQEVWILDHKFTSSDFSAGSDYRQQLLLDTQVSNYLAAARRMNLQPAGWVHDCIKRVALSPKMATPIESRKYTQEKRDKKTGEITEPSRLYAGQRDTDETPEEYFDRIIADIAERPDTYYARVAVVRLANEEQEAAFDYWQTGIQIRESRQANVWPRNPGACFKYNRACSFLPVCAGHGSLDDKTRYRRAERAHEELGREIQEQTEEKEVAA
jgi:hypothetical protein